MCLISLGCSVAESECNSSESNKLYRVESEIRTLLHRKNICHRKTILMLLEQEWVHLISRFGGFRRYFSFGMLGVRVGSTNKLQIGPADEVRMRWVRSVKIGLRSFLVCPWRVWIGDRLTVSCVIELRNTHARGAWGTRSQKHDI